MKLIFVYILLLFFVKYKFKTLAQIENDVFGTPQNNQSEQKITDYKKLIDTSQFNNKDNDKNFFQLKEMKDIQQEKQLKIENERKLKIEQEQKLKTNEIDVSKLLNNNFLINNTNSNHKGRKLFFKKVIKTVSDFFKGRKKKKRIINRFRKKRKNRKKFKVESEKDFIDKKNHFQNIQQEGLNENNLFKHLFGKVNLKKVSKIKGQKVKIPYYETIIKKQCLQKQGNKCLVEIPVKEKIKKYKTINLENGQIPFVKYIVTQLAGQSEFRAKEIRRFDAFAKGYQRLFKDKIIQRYERERKQQIDRWDEKWNKARSKQELKYQTQLKMAIDAYHQFIEDKKYQNNKRFKRLKKKAKRYNLRSIKNTIKRKVRYYMKQFEKKFARKKKKIQKQNKANDKRDENNMKEDYLRNKFIQRAYFANSKVKGKVPEAYVVDKTPLIK